MSLEDIPQVFADAVGINLLSAQVILSIFVIFAGLLPTMLLAKGKDSPLLIYLMVFILLECLLVGLGWLNFWILILTVVVVTLGVVKMSADLVTGGG